MRLYEAWRKINEADLGIPQQPEEQTVNVSLTKKEIALIRSLIQTAVSEMSSDPNSGMKGIPPDITAIIQKLDSLGK